MKILILRFFLICFILFHIGQAAFSQDTIFTRNNHIEIVKVVEQGPRFIAYKLYDVPGSPLIKMRTNSIYLIKYDFGQVHDLGYYNPRNIRPLGVNAGFAFSIPDGYGMPFFGINYFLNHYLNIEVNIGTSEVEDIHFSFGGTCHLNARQSRSWITPYGGLLLSSHWGDSFLQVPLGFNILFPFGLSGNIGYRQFFFTDNEFGYDDGMLMIKLGWNFKVF